MTSASRSKGEDVAGDSAPRHRTDVETLAASLTQRSRRALPLIGTEWTREGWGETLPNPNDVYSLYWGRDSKHALVSNRIVTLGQRQECEWRLTSLGAQVKAHLTDQQGQNR